MLTPLAFSLDLRARAWVKLPMTRTPHYRLTDAEKDALLERQAKLVEAQAARIEALVARIAALEA